MKKLLTTIKLVLIIAIFTSCAKTNQQTKNETNDSIQTSRIEEVFVLAETVKLEDSLRVVDSLRIIKNNLEEKILLTAPSKAQKQNKPVLASSLPANNLSTERDNNAKSYIIPVFYGTNRMPTGKTAPSEYYGGEQNNKLEVGIVNVSIPITHTSGEIEAPQWWKFWNRKDLAKYVLLVGIKKMDENIFYTNLKDVIASSNDKDAFIFIHGYNNTFNDAAKRTAQLAFDLGISGAPIMYSWPSKGEISKYIKDSVENFNSIQYLKKFLIDVVEKTNAKKINIIAHSMGNRAFTSALIEIGEKKNVHFNQIILAAPDIDATVFKNQIAPKIKSTANRITMYSSSEDKALKISREVNRNSCRAGDTNCGIITTVGIETIDASELKASDLLEHSYFSTNRPVINDIFLLFKFDVAPESRNLLLIKENKDRKYWTFKR